MRGVMPLAEAALTSAPPSRRSRTLARRPVLAASKRVELAPAAPPRAGTMRVRKTARVPFMAFLLSPYISYSNVLNRFLKPLS
jgi:hypothetical protein